MLGEEDIVLFVDGLMLGKKTEPLARTVGLVSRRWPALY
jgi:hypothetical protein